MIKHMCIGYTGVSKLGKMPGAKYHPDTCDTAK